MSDSGDPPSPALLEDIAAATARAAAQVVAASYGRPRLVGRKSSPTDVVTQTDLQAEERVKQMLLEATPDAGILAEEGGGIAPASRVQWVIDPLDGTINFLYSVPLFAVSIAAAVDGEMVAAAVIDVLHGELFSAHLAGGARLDGEPITASSCTALPDALVTTGFSYHADLRDAQGAVAHRVLSRARDLRCFGSAALELCWVACGRCDGYFQRDTEIWDRAAGVLIAQEAGARTELPSPENGDLLIVTAPDIFEDLRTVVQPAAD